ncbi:MAG: amino acid adenylation domain-containing protein, partial [Longimicrobiales bacterium]|nr:amino acid adenylation domain-containing protein [Longimicrobiales bacterium]
MDPGHSHLLIHELFEERAAMAPEGAAVYEGDRLITFSELESRAKLLAGGLRSRGIGQGCSVGLHIERSIDWVVAILAILKANAAVVPLPPSHPVDWLRDILAFSALDGVIDHTETPLHPSITANRIPLAELSPVGGEGIEGTPGRSEQAAFVLCSSGSTGQPKMIVRSHQSFFHRLRWTWEQHPFTAGEVGCQKAHMTTTHSIYELFEPLLSGIPVVIIPDRDVRNLELFWDTIRTRGISRLLIVPSALRASLDWPGFEAPPLNVLVLMGEYVPPGLAERTAAAFPERTRIYSIYGSTEASSTLVSDIRGGLQPGEELPLGRPISPDVRAQVLGSDLEPVAPGQIGRLYMAGPALFTEYFRDPALTASVFVDAPRQGEPLYDTHDQVRLLPDGNLQFIGRADHTVKIRGFRVDLPEVERAISRAQDVSQAAVMVTDRSAGGSSLVGFFVPASVDRLSVYQTLRERLPAFMVPSALVGLDAFPLTASGKVDRVRLLAEYEGHSGGPSAHRTLSSTERRVREVWER